MFPFKFHLKYLLVWNSWFSGKSFIKDLLKMKDVMENLVQWTDWDSNRECLIPAVPKLFGCWAKFAILSASAGRTILCIENKKIQTHTTIHICIYFLCSLTCLQCDLWKYVFCYIIVLVCSLIFGSMLDAVIKESIAQLCIWNSFHYCQIMPTTIYKFRSIDAT